MLSHDRAKHVLHGKYVVGDQAMEISLHLSKAQIHLIGLTRLTFLVATVNAELEASPSRPIFDELRSEDVDVCWVEKPCN